MLILYTHRPYCMLLELIKNTRSEPTRIESLAGIEIESEKAYRTEMLFKTCEANLN
jgi:hypothetical protein